METARAFNSVQSWDCPVFAEQACWGALEPMEWRQGGGVSLTGCPCFSRLPPGLLTFSPYARPFCFGGSCRLCLFAGRGLVKTWEEVGGDGTSPALQPCGLVSTSVTAVPPPRAGPSRCLRVLICKMMMVLVPEFILVASGGNQLLFLTS